jgi:peptidoglycan/xylan/chitin deacetylase (PgdA/CDA1 family)
VGVPRILALLEEYRIRATFFVPGLTADRYPDVVERIASAGHDVGHHSYAHKKPVGMSEPDERADFERALATLERLGVRPQGYRAPGWEPAWRTPALVAEYGLVYDSSLMDDDRPYVLETGAGAIVELPVHWSLDDWEQYAYVPEPDVGGMIEAPSKVLELWRGELDAMRRYGCLFVLTMHPFLSGRPARVEPKDASVRLEKRVVRVAPARACVVEEQPGREFRNQAGSARGLPGRSRRPAVERDLADRATVRGEVAEHPYALAIARWHRLQGPAERSRGGAAAAHQVYARRRRAAGTETHGEYERVLADRQDADAPLAVCRQSGDSPDASSIQIEHEGRRSVGDQQPQSGGLWSGTARSGRTWLLRPTTLEGVESGAAKAMPSACATRLGPRSCHHAAPTTTSPATTPSSPSTRALAWLRQKRRVIPFTSDATTPVILARFRVAKASLLAYSASGGQA